MGRLLALAIIAISLEPSFAGSFGNNAVLVPKVGLAFFDQLNIHEKPWGLNHQWSIGTAYMQALDYRWWWLIDSNFGIGHQNKPPYEVMSSFIGGAGLRYNIWSQNFRPNVGLMVHYLQFFGRAAQQTPLRLDLPLFVGLEPSLGLEWHFLAEMALSLRCSYGFYFNIYEPFRQVLYTQASWAVYF